MPDSDPTVDSGPPEQIQQRLPWLPVDDGAVHRDSVSEISVERADGDFKDGARSFWTIKVTVPGRAEPVSLRPRFTDIGELCSFVDGVFPGAFFKLDPPGVVTESPDWKELDEGLRFGAGETTAKQMGALLSSLAGGDAYTPPQGYRPPPGEHVAI